MKRIGDILKDSKLIDDAKINHAVSFQQQKNMKFGESLVELGYISELDLISSLIKRELLAFNRKTYKFDKLKNYLNKYVFTRKLFYLYLIFVIIFSILFTLAEPMFYNLFINNIIPSRDPSVIVNSCIIFMVLYIAKTAFYNKKNMHSLRFAHQIKLSMRSELFHSLSQMPLAFYVSNSFGDIIDRFTYKTDTVVLFGDKYFNRYIWSILLLIATLVILFQMNIYMTLSTIVIIVLSLVLPTLVGMRSYRYYENEARINGELLSFLTETSTAIEAIQANNIQKFRIKQYNTILDSLFINQARLQFILTSSFTLKEFMYLAMRFVIIFYGGYLAIRGDINSGELILFYFIVGTLSYQVNVLYDFFLSNVLNAKPNWELIEQLFNNTQIRHSSSVRHHKAVFDCNSIHFIDVSFRYRKKMPLIENLTVTFKPGINAIVGESGSGKSTILQLLQKIYDVDSGSILIDKTDIRHIDNNTLYAQIGSISQKSHVFNMTVADNIGLRDIGKAIREKDVIRSSKHANIYGLIESLPDKFNTLLNHDRELSGGEKQRIILSRLFYNKSRILLLDEPNKSIDKESEIMFWEGLSQIKDVIIIIVTHNLECISMADKIFVMSQGAIAETGTYKELVKRKKHFYALLNK